MRPNIFVVYTHRPDVEGGDEVAQEVLDELPVVEAAVGGVVVADRSARVDDEQQVDLLPAAAAR